MPSDPNEFLTCEEKGNVRAFDLRVKSSCPCDGCEQVMNWFYIQCVVNSSTVLSIWLCNNQMLPIILVF